MSGLETNLENTRPRPSAKGRDREETETAKIGLETFIAEMYNIAYVKYAAYFKCK